MAKQISYDREHDIFSVHLGFSEKERFKGNIEAGDLILDVSTTGRVRGIEILNASSFLEGFEVELEKVTDASFTAALKPSGIMLGMLFKEKEKEIPAKVAVPL